MTVNTTKRVLPPHGGQVHFKQPECPQKSLHLRIGWSTEIDRFDLTLRSHAPVVTETHG